MIKVWPYHVLIAASTDHLITDAPTACVGFIVFIRCFDFNRIMQFWHALKGYTVFSEQFI